MPCTTCPTGGGSSSNCEDIQNVKHFFYFKVGSWWVYEEENSGLRDSVYVTSAVENPSNYDFDVEVYSTYQDYTYRYWPEYDIISSECPENGNICADCLNVIRSKYKPGNFVDESNCFIFIPSVGESEGNYNPIYSNNKIYVDSISNSFLIDSLLFTRTIKLYEDNTVMEGLQPTNHYFSENVGLVKKELLDSNQVWNLVDYHIEL